MFYLPQFVFLKLELSAGVFCIWPHTTIKDRPVHFPKLISCNWNVVVSYKWYSVKIVSLRESFEVN